MDIASLTIKVVNEGLDAAAKGLGDLGDKAKTAQDRVDDFNKNMSGLRNVALGVGGSILGAGAAIVKVSGNFEAAMNGVKAVSGAAGDEFDALRDKAKELGATTAFSASEAANGMEFLAMAGMNTEQVLSTIPNALNLAAAGGIELAQSADILSNVMTGMGLAAEESGRAADVLAKAAASANVDIGMIGESMKYVAPISKQLGISLEDTAAMVGVLGNAGIQGSEAGTALRAVYSRLATDNKAKAHFEALGIAIQDAEGNMRPMTSLLSELGEATEDMAAADALKIFKDAVGAEAMSAFGVSIDSIKDGSLQELINKLNEAEGSAKAMADTKMEGFEGAMKGLASAGEALMIAIGESGLLDIVTDLTARFADFVRQLADTNPEIFKTIGIVAGVVLAFSGLVLAIAGIGSVIGTAISAFTGMIAVAKLVVAGVGLLISPVGLAVAAIAALVAVGVLLYKNWDTIKEKASEIWESIKEVVSGKVEELKASISAKWEDIKTGTSNAWNGVKDAISSKWDDIKTAASSKAQQTIEAVKSAFNSLPSPIKNILTIAYNIVKVQIDLIKNIFTTSLNIIKAVVRGDMQGVVDAFKQGMANAWNIIKGGASNIVNALKDLGSKLFEIGSDAIQGLINGLKSKVGSLKSTAKELASTALNTLKGIAGFDTHSPSKKTIAIGKDVGQGLANGIKKSTKVVKTESQKLAEQAVDSIKQAIKGLERDIDLFGNDDPVAGLLWDRKNTNKYFGVSDELFDKLVRLTEQKHKMAEADKANAAAMREFEQAVKDANAALAKQREEDEKRKANAAAGYAGISSDLMGLNNNPVQRIVDEYERQLAVVYEYEQTHQDILQESADKQLEIERMKQMAMRQLVLASGQIMAGDMSSIFKDMLGEQSAAYKAMFAIEKGFAIAQAGLAIQQNIANAMKYGFPQNLAFISGAIAQGAKLMGAIKSVVPKGFKSGGYTGSIGANNIAGVVHGNEYVFDAQSTKAIGVENLERIRRGKGTGEVNITVNNHSSAKVETETDNQGNIIMTIRDEVKRSWSNLQNPNSHESKMLGRNVQAPRRR